jgi:hypothetical protein
MPALHRASARTTPLAWLLRRQAVAMGRVFAQRVAELACAADESHRGASAPRCPGCRQARKDIRLLADIARTRP